MCPWLVKSDVIVGKSAQLNNTLSPAGAHRPQGKQLSRKIYF